MLVRGRYRGSRWRSNSASCVPSHAVAAVDAIVAAAATAAAAAAAATALLQNRRGQPVHVVEVKDTLARGQNRRNVHEVKLAPVYNVVKLSCWSRGVVRVEPERVTRACTEAQQETARLGIRRGKTKARTSCCTQPPSSERAGRWTKAETVNG